MNTRDRLEQALQETEIALAKARIAYEEAKEALAEYPQRDPELPRMWVRTAKFWVSGGYTGQNSPKRDDSWAYIQDAAQNEDYVQESLELNDFAWNKRVDFWKALHRYYTEWAIRGGKD